MADTTPYPLPRGVRETDILTGDGGATYGPFGFRIFDAEDVEAWVRPTGETAFSTVAVTVSKVSGLDFDHFTVTFAEALPATSDFIVRSARVPERAAGVKNGTRIDPNAMEKEFSKIAATEQELRRDIWPISPGILDGHMLVKVGNRIVSGPDAEQIEAAEGYADRAEQAANQAAAYNNGPWFNDRASLVADETMTLTPGLPNSVSVGDQVMLKADGYAYTVVGSDGDTETAGGVLLNRGRIAYREGAALWSGGGYPPDWYGGGDVEITYADEEAGLTKPIMWLQRKANVSGYTGQAALGISFAGEIVPGTESTHSGIRSYMNNRGTGNDATAFMGRTRNGSDGGMACGTFGAASVESLTAKSTMGMEAHIYVNGPATTPRDATGDDWYVAQHIMASCDTGAAHHGIYIGSGGLAANKYGFWNGITIGGHAFAQLGNSGLNIAGTVGINMAWVSQGAEVGIKFGAVGKYHLSRAGGALRTNARELTVESEEGQANLFVKPITTSFGAIRIQPADDVPRLSLIWDSADAAASIIRAGTGCALRFNTNGSTTDRMRIETNGNIRMFNLPTSASGLAAGTLWNDNGTVKVATGT